MSRIGKQPIAIPPKVKVEVKGQKVSVEGPKGKLNFELPNHTSAKVDNGHVHVSREGENAQAKALHGLSRALVNNMVKGVSEGFVKKLEIQGVGFKAAVQGKVVNMTLGYSHPINYPIRTNRWSGRSLPSCARFIRPNLTKAKASAMPANTCSARKARRCSNFKCSRPDPWRNKDEIKNSTRATPPLAGPQKNQRHQRAPAHECFLFQRKHPCPVHR